MAERTRRTRLSIVADVTSYMPVTIDDLSTYMVMMMMLLWYILFWLMIIVVTAVL